MLQASDRGLPQNSATTRVIVTAIGEGGKQEVKKGKGNRKPILQNMAQWKHLHISDADAVGEMIGLIEAEDPDGDTLWWNITGENIRIPSKTLSFRRQHQ